MSETHNDAKRSNSRTSSTLPDAHHQVNVMALQIKSLEQRTHAVTVPRNASVLHLKSEIETVFAVDTGRQRLIFQGKVLKDDKQLADYANLDDGKVIHLVVRPVDAPQNPMNDEPRSQSSRRAFSRGLPRNLPPLSSRFPMMEGYTLITVDTSMGDMSEASSLISSVMSGISGIGPGYTGRSRPTTTNTATGGGANTTGGDHAGNRASAESRSGISSLNRWPFAFSLGQNPSDLPPASIAGAFESRTPAGIPFPSSVEVRLVRTMNSIRNVREMLEAPLSEEVPVNPVISNSSHEQTQHIRSRLQSGGNRQAAQVGVVVRELAELMELAVPQLNSMADALQEEGEEDNTEANERQFTIYQRTLRTARIVQGMSMIHHLIGSVLGNADIDAQSPRNFLNLRPSPRRQNWNAMRSTDTPAAANGTTATNNNNNNNDNRNNSSSSSNSSNTPAAAKKTTTTNISGTEEAAVPEVSTAFSLSPTTEKPSSASHVRKMKRKFETDGVVSSKKHKEEEDEATSEEEKGKGKEKTD